jgi:hypothetical protein
MKKGGRAKPLRRRRIAIAAKDAHSSRRDTEARGVPSDVPSRRPKRRR